MNKYNEQREWADRFHQQVMHQLKQVFDTEFVTVSSFKQDTQHACDYVVNKHTHISARLRTGFYRERYPNDFTIRTRTRHNSESELSKILAGNGNYLFYGFIDDSGQCIYSYKLIDLSIFRREHEAGNQYIHHKISNPLNNNDGTQLAAFNTTRMCSEMVIHTARLHRRKTEPTFAGWDGMFLSA